MFAVLRFVLHLDVLVLYSGGTLTHQDAGQI